MAHCKEELLIRDRFGGLRDAMLHPQRVANELWEKKIIDDATKNTLEVCKDNQEKTTKLLDSVMVTVKLQPEDKRAAKFETVLNVFRNYIPLDVVANGIAQEYYGLKETSTLDGSTFAAAVGNTLSSQTSLVSQSSVNSQGSLTSQPPTLEPSQSQGQSSTVSEETGGTTCSPAHTQDSTDDVFSDTDTSGFSEEKAVKLLCCCGNCSIKEFLRNGCPSSGERLRKFPLLPLNQLSHGEKIKLIARLHDESDKIADEFASLVVDVLRVFKEKVDVAELVVYLLSLKASRFHMKLVNKQILESFEPELRACESVSDVFKILATIWSWFNHSLLGRMVSNFAVDEEVKVKYDHYIAASLNPYLQRSVFEVPHDSFGPANVTGWEKFVLKVDDSVAEQAKAEQLPRLQRDVARALDIEPDALILQSVDEGCFRIVFLILGDAIDEVLPLSVSRVTAFSCLEPKVISVECCGAVTNILPMEEPQQQDTDSAVTSPCSPLTGPISSTPVPATSEDSVSGQDSNITSTPEFERLMDRFKLLNALFVKSFESSDVSLADIKNKLIDQINVFRLSGTITSRKHSLLEGASAQLDSITSVRDLFEILGNYCSWFNYEFLDTLAQQKNDLFGGSVVRVDMLFTKELHRLLKCPVKMLPADTHPCQNLPGFVELLVSFADDSSMLELESLQLHMLKASIARAFSAEPHALLLTTIDQKQNELRFLLSASVSSVEFPPSRSRIRQWKRLLSDWSVVGLSCEGQKYSLDVDDEEDAPMFPLSDIGGTPYPLPEEAPLCSGENDDDNGLSQATSGYESVATGPVASKLIKDMVSDPLPSLPPITVPELKDHLLSGAAVETLPSFDDPARMPDFNKSLPLDITQTNPFVSAPPAVSNQHPILPPVQFGITQPTPYFPSLLADIPAIQPGLSQPQPQLLGQHWSSFTQPVSEDRSFPFAPLKSQSVSSNSPGDGLLSNKWVTSGSQLPVNKPKTPPLSQPPVSKMAAPLLHNSVQQKKPLQQPAVELLPEVCRACLANYPQNKELLTFGCFAMYGAHDGVSFVSAAWDSKFQVMVEVRPRPLVTLRPGSWFALCRGMKCNGQRCTYAHSFPELEHWNRELQAQRSSPARNTHVSPSPGKQQQLPLFSQPPLISHPVAPSHPVISHPPPPPTSHLPGVSETPILAQPLAIPVESHEPPKMLVTDDHNYEDRNKWKLDFTKRVERTLLVEKEAAETLTVYNYKDKFYNLLCYEEKEHIELLSRKCDSKAGGGKYTFVVFNSPPPDIKTALVEGQLAGYILGMTEDQIAYATQASQGLFFVDEGSHDDICSINIMSVNFSRVSKKLFVSLSVQALWQVKAKCPLVSRNQYSVSVEFEVKHSYFNTLHRAVVNLPQHMINKLLPTKGVFSSHASGIRFNQSCSYPKLELDANQLSALQAIVQCTPAAPVIVSGPFGSGKTRILARAAYQLIEEGLRARKMTRILMCAHHSATTQAYILNYLQLVFWDKWKKAGVKLVQMDRQAGQFKQNNMLYKSIFQLKKDQEIYESTWFIVIVTTFTSSMHLLDVLGSYFTHILLDEAAQVREPEAIAPLSLGMKDAKVVIAGDSMQVGPDLLVLGKEAKKYGLSISLLERLKQRYELIGEVALPHLRKLNVNYRCHEFVMRFLSTLFYKSSLLSRSSVHAHHKVHFPLVFCCSDTNEYVGPSPEPNTLPEIKALLGEIQRFFLPWPPHWGIPQFGDVCIISSTRPQLNLIRKELRYIDGVSYIRLLPTYQIQGHECRAVFLATGEPLDDNGMSSNPTKSLCNPYVFNTALSRAESLVVAIGNPFTLMKVEETMGKAPASQGGFQQRSWKEYLRVCLEEETVCFSSTIPKQEHLQVLAKLKKKVGLITNEGQWSRARGVPVGDGLHQNIQTQTLFAPRPYAPEMSGMIGHKVKVTKLSSNWQVHP